MVETSKICFSRSNVDSVREHSKKKILNILHLKFRNEFKFSKNLAGLNYSLSEFKNTCD